MARRRSKSWYISRLVRATGIVKDEVVNVSGGSADSDVAVIAELRRDADSEELQIQSIRTAIDSDYALFNAKIAAFNGLTDSDLTTVAKLRSDVDSDSLKIQALETTVNNLPTSSGGVSLTEVTDSDGREAISSPIEGDIAIQYGVGPGINTGVTHNFSGGTVLSWSTPNFNNDRLNLTNATLAAVAQPGDVLVIESATVQRYNSYWSVNTWQTIQSGTLIAAIHSVSGSVLTMMIATQVRYPTGHTKSLNTSVSDYFGNASNPRGSIPVSAAFASSNDANVNGTTGSQKLTGGVATLYRMFKSDIQSARETSARTNSVSDDESGNVNALDHAEAKIWVYQDSDDLTNSGWKNTIASNDDITTLQARVDSESAKVQTINGTVAALQNSINTLGGVSVTEVIDSDGREGISSPKEGDIAIQYGSYAGTYTGISHDFTVGGNRSQLWSYTVYARSANSLTTSFGNGRFQWSNSTFDPVVQKGDVIVVENGFAQTTPGVNSGGVNYNSGYYGTFIFVCHTPQVGGSAPYYNIQAHGHVLSPSSIGFVLNSSLYSYFANAANPRGDVPASAQVVTSYMNSNNSSATQLLQGTVAKLYRFFDPATYADGYDNNGTADPYNGSNDATINALPYNQAKIYVYQDSDDLTNRGWKNTIASNDDVIVLQARADSESAKVQTINGTVAALQNTVNTLGGVSLTEVTDSDSREAISSPKEGDIAIQYGSSPGLNTGVTYDFGGGSVLTFDVPLQPSNYSSAEMTLTNATFAAAAQPGDVIVVQNSTIRYYIHPNYYNDQGTYNGTLIMAVLSVVNSTTLKVMFRNTFNFPAQSSSGYVNSDLYNYFGNPANPRGDIPSNALVAGPTVGNTFNYWSSKQWIGGVATLYRMFDSTILSAYGENPSGTPHVYNDDFTASVTPLPYSKPEVYIYQDSDDLTPRGWKSPFISFDSDQVVAIINENVVLGSVDSDVAAIAALRRDADSDSIAIQSLRTSIDSDYALFNAKFALLNGLTDSDLTTVSNLRNDLDSESAEIRLVSSTITELRTNLDSESAEIRLLRRELDSDIANIPESTTNVTQRVYSFTSSQPTTTFSGNDDNGQTLSYSVGRIQVYLNGLLLTEGALKDYTATNGTSVVLTEATDSDDILTIAKFLGTPDDVITNKYIYKVSPAGNHTPFDSEFTGVDENGTTLSYTPGKIQVFLNGVLLQDSDDYIANNGSTITLLTAPDSEDVLVVYRYLGTQVAGFDSDQVVSIINENASTLPWVEKTSSVAVTAGQKIIVNTSTAVTLTLPASASLGDEIRIIDGTGTAATNNITVARNGHNIMGAASDLTINLNASGIGLVYYNASRGWILIEN